MANSDGAKRTDMPVFTQLLLMSTLPLLATACSGAPDRIAIYPGFTYEQMSRLEPGTGEYLKEQRTINLDPVEVDIIDPTTNQAFVNLADSFAALSSDGRSLSSVSVHSLDERDRLATRDSLVDTVRAFIDRGWQCHARDNLDGPTVKASEITLPDGFCVATREHGRGWTCRSPPGWPRASAFFVWGCGAATNNFSFAWGLDMVAARD